MDYKKATKRKVAYKVDGIHESNIVYKDEVSPIRSPRDSMKAIMKIDFQTNRECFYVMPLNTKNVPLGSYLISVGSLNASIVHPREILQMCIGCEKCKRRSAASFIIVHNHPTGDTTPSKEDIEFTQRLSKCGDLLGIELLDHVIVAIPSNEQPTRKKWGFYSMKEHNLF